MKKKLLKSIFVIVGIVLMGISCFSQCGTIASSLILVSSNSNGTSLYKVNYTISNWASSYKSYQMTVACNGSMIVSCTALPATGTSVSGTSATFTCTNTTATNVTVTFGTSNGNCGGGGSCSQIASAPSGGPLAISWLSLEGSVNNQKHAVINWNVAEVNVVSYGIEKSIDGTAFTTVGTFAAKGNGINTYSYTEVSALQGVCFYRIKQTEVNGSFSYSSVIKLINNGLLLFSSYPNPVNDVLIISGANLNSKATITDISGKVLQSITITQTSFTVNMSNFATGIYMLRLDNGPVQKIIKL